MRNIPSLIFLQFLKPSKTRSTYREVTMYFWIQINKQSPKKQMGDYLGVGSSCSSFNKTLYFLENNLCLGLLSLIFLFLVKYFITPALSHDQDFKKGTNKRLMYYWPPRHIDTGNYCQNLKRWGKNCFLVLFSLEKCILSSLKHPFCLVSLWYYHSCVPSKILTYFDPPNLSAGPKLMFLKS